MSFTIKNNQTKDIKVVPGDEYAVRVALVSGTETLTLSSVIETSGGEDVRTLNTYNTSDEEIIAASVGGEIGTWRASVSNGGVGEFEVSITRLLKR